MPSCFYKVAAPFDFIACGGLDKADRIEIEKENVLGINVQNILGQIPVYNLFVGIGRIKKCVYHIKTLGDSRFFSSADKAEMTRCRCHIARGAFELVGLGLLFLLPDIFFSLIKFAIDSIKGKRDENKKVERNLKDIEGILNSIRRNYNRLLTTNNTQNKLALEVLILEHLNKVKECKYKITQLTNQIKRESFAANLQSIKNRESRLDNFLHIPFEANQGETNERCARNFVNLLVEGNRNQP